MRGVAASALLPAVAHGSRRGRQDPTIDVAIVGGGVAGCYAAWRLASAANPPGTIRLFERSERIGGRLFSVPCDGMKHQVAELGGMRIAGDQTPLLALVDELELETEPYPATEPDDLYYLRGIRTRARDLKCNLDTGFRPSKEIEGKTPGEVFRLLLAKLTGKRSWTAEEFKEARSTMTFRGRPLYEVPYEYAWREVLGAEGYKFLHQTTGYGRPNTQALGFIEEAVLSMFVHDYFHVEGAHVQGGYDLVPKRLASSAEDMGVDFEFGSTLTDIRLNSDGTVRLVFDEKGGPTRTILARRAILAIPGSAYGLLDPGGALGGDNGMSNVNQALLGNPALKIYSNYETQWWNPLGMRTGRSITDLPIRQCFYLPDPSGGGLVLSPYASGAQATDYWRPLLEPIAPNRLDPDGMAGRAIRSQLEKLHGIEIPEARDIHYRYFDGGHDGYAWSMWSPGARYWELLPGARTPLPGRPIHCVGQATARSQGWVMDTISSVETVMRDSYGLARPKWWPADYPIE